MTFFSEALMLCERNLHYLKKTHPTHTQERIQFRDLCVCVCGFFRNLFTFLCTTSPKYRHHKISLNFLTPLRIRDLLGCSVTLAAHTNTTQTHTHGLWFLPLLIIDQRFSLFRWLLCFEFVIWGRFVAWLISYDSQFFFPLHHWTAMKIFCFSTIRKINSDVELLRNEKSVSLIVFLFPFLILPLILMEQTSLITDTIKYNQSEPNHQQQQSKHQHHP